MKLATWNVNSLTARLQAQDIDRIGDQPVEHVLQAGGEGIDVPGGQLHCKSLNLWGSCRGFERTIPARLNAAATLHARSAGLAETSH